ncbi:hypothetical protein KC218_25850, partial [Mycobacterium tuberculosis]|nr:hypothetical protein [Mycobacterium tuberculosis]
AHRAGTEPAAVVQPGRGVVHGDYQPAVRRSGDGLRDRDGAQRERLSLLEHLDPRRHEGGAEIAVVVTWLLGGRR